MINRGLLLALSPAVLMLVACGGPPECADDSTVTLVKSVAMDRLRDALMTQHFSAYYAETTYAAAQQAAKTELGSKVFPQAIEKVDAQVAQTKITLDGIRTLESSGSQQARCAAAIAFSGPGGQRGGNIEYVAQHSDDGKTLHVEVRGL